MSGGIAGEGFGRRVALLCLLASQFSAQVVGGPGSNIPVPSPLDYDHAQPLPLPERAAPSHDSTPSQTGEQRLSPQSRPGAIGTGQQNVQVIAPSRMGEGG